ncbi:MAG: hypothetical protein RLZZ385_1339 [Pseudomonadota bacterium]|jgi:SulP family sulfate permease
MPTSVANVISGTLIALLNISVAISSAALLFSQTDSRLLVVGIAILLMGTLVSGLGGALFSGYPPVICSPRSAVIPIFAVMVSSIYVDFGGQYSAGLEATLVAAVIITTLVTGLFLLLLGRLRWGKLVRYIPYPVTGGFFAGIGYLFIQGGLTVAGGQEANFLAATNGDFLRLTAPAVVLALCLILGKLFGDNRLWVPGTLLLAMLLFYGVLLVKGVSMPEAQAGGLLPIIDNNGDLLPIYSSGDFQQVRWLAISEQIGGIVVVALLSAMILLLDVSGIEVMARRDLDPDHELQIMGYTNIVNSVAGGIPGVHDASDTALVTRLGADSRLTGYVYVGLVALAMLAGTDFMERVPTFVLGGLLIYVGLEFLINWLWKARGELPLSDYVVVIIIMIVIMFSDILQGVTFGLFIAIILFVINYSQLSVIKSEVSGSDHASNIDRDLETRELLNKEGYRILIMNLQGFIFFGTADKLITTIRNRVVNQLDHRIEYLVLDFHHVSQLDTSAIVSFTKLAQLSDRLGFNIVISGADEKSIKQLVRHQFFTFGDSSWRRIYKDQLDNAVAWCETDLLESLQINVTQRSKTLDQILEQVTGSVDDARLLAKFFEAEHVAEGTYLFREGDYGDCLYFVGSGTVAVVITLAGNQERIVRKYKSGALFGEMAVYTSETRSASVRIENDAVLFRLDKAQLIEMQREYPVASASFHSYIVRLMSERLRRANRELNRYL